jgi:NAD(P)-dependent dehydrogenase (short-subunit alcohol dehydrogenase family)
MAGRRVLVTGGGSGIGLACVRLLHREGARVAVLDVDSAAAQQAAREVDGVAMWADVADEAAVQSSVNQAAEALGGLDGLVNAAGVAKQGRLEETDLAGWNRVLAVNLTGPFMVCRAAVPFLRHAGGGTIVNIASGQGLRPSGTGCAYAASKGGLVILSKSLAIELAPAIRVNAICPGRVDTPMLQPLTGQMSPAQQQAILQQYALRRMAQPEEIATAVLFLSCGDGSFVTGTAMAVDGGRCYH